MEKIAVITGANRGLGDALVKEFSARGWYVVGIGRSETPLHFPGNGAYHQFDASDTAKCEAFWNQLQNEYPNATICLVNNAGGYIGGGLLQTRPEDYEQLMRSCYFTSVYMTRGLIEAFYAARIINVISSAALTPHKDDSAYGAAKTAQMRFFQSLQKEFEASRYRITNLYPYNIASHGPDSRAVSPADLAQFIGEQADSNVSYYLRDVTIYPYT